MTTPKDNDDRAFRDRTYADFLDRAIRAMSRPDPKGEQQMPDLTTAQWAERAAQAARDRDAASAEIKKVQEAEARERRAAADKREQAADRMEARNQAWAEGAAELREEKRAREDAASRQEIYTRAFETYVRRGPKSMSSAQKEILDSGQVIVSAAESRDLGVATGGNGGYLVPQAFYDRIISAQKLVGGVRNAAYVYTTTSGATMPVPQDNDTANVGELLTENTQATILDTTVNSKSLSTFMYSSKVVKVGLPLIQDMAFDLDAWLARKLGIRLGRIQNQHFTTGTGSGQPQGVVTGATLGKTGAGGQLSTLLYDDLVDLEHSVDPAYRQRSQLLNDPVGDDTGLGPNAMWMFNDGVLKALEKVKDTQGRPLWQAGLTAGAPNTILGYPYVINQDMASPAANAKSVLFGDFSAYLIRQVAQVSLLRLTERYADALQVGFLAFERADGALIDAGTAPVKYFQHAAA